MHTSDIHPLELLDETSPELEEELLDTSPEDELEEDPDELLDISPLEDELLEEELVWL